MNEIKPCPFCGENDIIVEYGGDENEHPPFGWTAHCDNYKCDIQHPKTYQFDTKEKAIEAWNKRHDEKGCLKIKLHYPPEMPEKEIGSFIVKTKDCKKPFQMIWNEYGDEKEPYQFSIDSWDAHCYKENEIEWWYEL